MTNTIFNESDPVYALLANSLPDGSQICFSARASGLFTSQDQGQTWRYAYESLVGDQPLATLALADASLPGHARILFAGTAGAVVRSEDGGFHWKVGRLSEPMPVVTALAISPDFAEDGTALAGSSEDGLFITINRGDSWNAWNFGLLDPNVLAVAISPAFKHDQQVLAGVSSGLFRSQNRGRSWQPIELPCSYDAVLALSFSPNYEKDGTVFAGSEENGLYRTQDGGQTWQNLRFGTIHAPVNSLLFDPRDPQASSLIALVGSQLFFSHDKGLNWQELDLSALPDGFITTAFTMTHESASDAKIWIGSSSGKVIVKSNL